MISGVLQAHDNPSGRHRSAATVHRAPKTAGPSVPPVGQPTQKGTLSSLEGEWPGLVMEKGMPPRERGKQRKRAPPCGQLVLGLAFPKPEGLFGRIRWSDPKITSGRFVFREGPILFSLVSQEW